MNVTGSYVLRGQRHMWTVPRCDAHPKAVFDYLMEHFPTTSPTGISRIVVARELHEDGFPHLHLFVEWKKSKNVAFAMRSYSPAFGFDMTDPLHPTHYVINFQATVAERAHGLDRAIRGAVQYVTKGSELLEPFWVSNFDVVTYLAGARVLTDGAAEKKRKWTEVHDRLRAGVSVEELMADDEMGSLVSFNYGKAVAVAHAFKRIRAAEQRLSWPVVADHPLFQGFDALLSETGPYWSSREGWECANAVLTWIQGNIHRPRRPGDKQLVLSGLTSNQKTGLMMEVTRWVSSGCYTVPKGKYDLPYQDWDDDIEFIIVDEFNRDSIPGSFLNRVLYDSRTDAFRRMQRPSLHTRGVCPLVMLTNQSSLECLIPPDLVAEEQQAFIRRVQFVQIPLRLAQQRDFFLPVCQWMSYCAAHYDTTPSDPLVGRFDEVCPPSCSAVVLPTRPSITYAQPYALPVRAGPP